MNSASKKLLAIGLLFICSFLLHAKVLDGWWWQDDATILVHAISHPHASYFYRPDHWRELVVTSFTPWLSAVFAIDHAISPWNPGFHYAHHLVSLASCASLLTLWLWTRCGAALAFAIGALFLWGAPTSLIAQQLMTRHYAEGLLWLLVHYLCLDRASRSQSISGQVASQDPKVAPNMALTAYPLLSPFLWSMLAAFFALLSMSAKELYLPLVLLSVLWLGSKNIKLLLPSFIAMVVFFLWRAWMLGDWLGGYVGADASAAAADQSISAWIHSQWLRIIQFAKIPSMVLSIPWICSIVIVLCLSLRAYARYQERLAVLRLFCADNIKLIAAIGLIAMPLWPLTKVSSFELLDQRFYFGVWSVGLLGLGLAFAAHRRVGLAVVVILAFACAKPRDAVNEALSPIAQEYWVQGRAIAQAPKDHLLWLSPRVANWYADSLVQMRGMQQGDQPLLISDWVQSLKRQGGHNGRSEHNGPSEHNDGALSLLRYQQENGHAQMVSVSAETIKLERAAWREAIQRGKSLHLDANISYDHKQQILSWQFITGDQGQTLEPIQYTAILFEGGVFPLPQKGQLRTNDLTSGCLVLKAEGKSSQGQAFIAYSDVMRFSTERHQGVHAAISEATYRGPAINYQERPACSNRKGKAP